MKLGINTPASSSFGWTTLCSTQSLRRSPGGLGPTQPSSRLLTNTLFLVFLPSLSHLSTPLLVLPVITSQTTHTQILVLGTAFGGTQTKMSTALVFSFCHSRSCIGSLPSTEWSPNCSLVLDAICNWPPNVAPNTPPPHSLVQPLIPTHAVHMPISVPELSLIL